VWGGDTYSVMDEDCPAVTIRKLWNVSVSICVIVLFDKSLRDSEEHVIVRSARRAHTPDTTHAYEIQGYHTIPGFTDCSGNCTPTRTTYAQNDGTALVRCPDFATEAVLSNRADEIAREIDPYGRPNTSRRRLKELERILSNRSEQVSVKVDADLRVLV
jgi:hypothetical protein